MVTINHNLLTAIEVRPCVFAGTEHFPNCCGTVVSSFDHPVNPSREALSPSGISMPIRPYAVLSTFYGKPVIRKDSWVLLPFLEGGGPHEKNPPVAVKGGPQGQLFDLSTDAGQANNVWLDYPDVVTELTQLHAEHQSRGRSIGVDR